MRIEKRAIADANDTEGYANGKEMSASDAINSPQQMENATSNTASSAKHAPSAACYFLGGAERMRGVV